MQGQLKLVVVTELTMLGWFISTAVFTGSLEQTDLMVQHVFLDWPFVGFRSRISKFNKTVIVLRGDV